MNSFGKRFRIELFGASHELEVGVTIYGIPSSLQFGRDDLMPDILRRKSGRKGTTPRKEEDIPLIEDRRGIDGTVIIRFENKDIRIKDYDLFKNIPRPGHADLSSRIKYGNDIPGWFSGRMTLPIVAAGAIAKKMMDPVTISARLVEIGGLDAEDERCVETLLDRITAEGDSIGGVVECICNGVPAGLGEPFFDSLESMLSHAMFSIPGIRGVEFGDGFASTRMKGSEHNDPIIDAQGHCSKNGSGGINGGISNGNPIQFRVAVKPTSSIRKAQSTYDFMNDCMTSFEVPGRHDVCFALRVPPVVEAMTAIVLVNCL